jgi:hypothetical protein
MLAGPATWNAFFKYYCKKFIINSKVILMKSILFIAFLAIATIGCDTPENSTGSDTSSPPMTSDTTTTTNPSTDTSTTTPVDTTTSTPNPSDTSTTR